MKTNKGGGFWIFPGSSVYQEDKFEEDAEAVVAFYRDRGYLQVNVGQPNLKPLRDSKDGKDAVHDARDSDQRRASASASTSSSSPATTRCRPRSCARSSR